MGGSKPNSFHVYGGKEFNIMGINLEGMGTEISHHSPLLIPPRKDAAEYIHITAREAGWEHINFAARRMHAGERWQHTTEDNELALVVLGGICAVHSNRGEWPRIGRRPNVFAGMPYCLYLPRNTEFTVE